MLTHLICCINHSDVIPFVVSILRVLTEHACVRNEFLGNIRVQLHVGGTGYIAQPCIPAVAVHFSGMVSCVGGITGFVVQRQLFLHVHQTVLPFVHHMRYQVLENDLDGTPIVPH